MAPILQLTSTLYFSRKTLLLRILVGLIFFCFCYLVYIVYNLFNNFRSQNPFLLSSFMIFNQICNNSKTMNAINEVGTGTLPEHMT